MTPRNPWCASSRAPSSSTRGRSTTPSCRLIYSRITAPVSGRIGLRLVDPGNIIHATDTTGLCVITQLEPITVIFTIPEDSLPPVLEKLRAGERLPVDAFNREQTKKIATGYLADRRQPDRSQQRHGPASGRCSPTRTISSSPTSSSMPACCWTPSAGPPWCPRLPSSAAPRGPSSTWSRPIRPSTVRPVKLGPS